jgi:hypothetical protein
VGLDASRELDARWEVGVEVEKEEIQPYMYRFFSSHGSYAFFG